MMICHKLKTLYYAPAKTGTSLMHRAMSNNCARGSRDVKYVGRNTNRRPNRHDWTTTPALKKRTRNYFHFMTCRNPFSRLYSFYLHILHNGGGPIDLSSDRSERVRALGSFEGFVFGYWIPARNKQLRMAKLPLSEVPHNLSQIWFNPVPCHVYRASMPRCDAVVRLEHLEEDAQQLPFLVDTRQHFRAFSRFHAPWYENYTVETERIVQEWYAEDFARFNYADCVADWIP